MNLSKAIEILFDLLGEGPQFPPNDRRDAVKLGIEALKRVQRIRKDALFDGGVSLPGETEE